MADVKTGHAVDAKTGYTVDVYAPEGFIKVLMTDVERQGSGACKTFGGGRRLRGRGTLEAGAFGP